MSRKTWLTFTFACALTTASCGGDVGDVIQDLEDAGNQSSGSENGSDSEAADEGDPSAFRLTSGAWENACTVLSQAEVETATGLTVTEAREAQGCNWIVDPVDDSVLGEPLIGWQPMPYRQVEIQQETAPVMGGGIVVEPIEGLGDFAFWQGNDQNGLGEVWVKTEQIGFRIINQFASFNYTGDTREPMEALANAIANSLAEMDVIAASGDAGQGLIPPDGVDIPEGIQTQGNLIEELAAVPLPDGAVIGAGGVYPDRASQDVYLDLSVGDTARFYLEALPAAGFEIVSGGTIETEDQILEYSSQSIAFRDPNGQRGDLIFGGGAFAPTNLNIQIFSSG